MKKIPKFLRSMGFGMLLLGLIAACSVAGSLIPQGEELSYYVIAYPRFHSILLLLGLNKVFYSWYFVLLVLLLGVNLSLCSLIRVFSLPGKEKLLAQAAAAGSAVSLREGGYAVLDRELRRMGCRKKGNVYYKNLLGRWGSFVTHLAILLTLLFGAAGLYLPQVTDRDCLPGESVTMPNGTEIQVHDFAIENESGELDFESHITIIRGDTGESREGSIRVNYPMALGPWKIYQQNFGTAGSIRVTNPENGGSDIFTLTDMAFLSLNAQDGLWFLTLYPDHHTGEDGSIHPITQGYGRFDNPVYHLQLSENGSGIQKLALPGERFSVGDLEFELLEPVEYPGLRIKYTPPLVNALLFLSFALMILGLFLCFFLQPVLVWADEEGYRVCTARSEGLRMQLSELLAEYEKEEC